MAQFNENIKLGAPNPLDQRYMSTRTSGGAQLPYSGITEVNTTIISAQRYKGLTVLMNTGSTNIEYWYKDGIGNTDLIEKKYSSEQVIGDFVTGATNLGYFSGQTGVQRLTLSGFPTSPITFDGQYFSEYNWYYADAGGIIRLGSPVHDGPLRRGYVDATRVKSWIYNVGTSAWILSQNDIAANVGGSIVPISYAGTGYTQVNWLTGFQSNGSTSVTGFGSLTTGVTKTVGNAIYKDKSNQDLHLRTILNVTPQFLNIQSDDNFIRFSGVSTVINGQNFGGGIPVFTGKTGTNLGFRTLVASGDTSITQKSNGELIIFSSSDGSANALTGATSIGIGIPIFSGITDRNMHFRSIVGTGSTIVTTNGSTIVVNSTGGDLFTNDLTVSIASGKTFGKYLNGDTIPASGKTANQVIQMALLEALEPDVNLSSSSSNVVFGLSGKTVNLTFSYTINTLGANVASVLLEWRRGGAGSWVTLTTATGATTYNHAVDDSTNRFNTAVINFRYTVTDTAGATKTVIYDVTPQTYLAPTITPVYTGIILGYETQAIREKGNVNTTITGTLSSNRSLIYITGYTLQRCVDGGAYSTIATCTGICSLTPTITSCLDSAGLASANSIGYRVQVGDQYANNNGGLYTINFRYASYYGYCSSISISGAQVLALGNQALCTTKARTMVLTAPVSDYTYVVYPESYGYLTNAIMDGSSPVLGAFSCCCSNVVSNYYGQPANYIIYKSNAPNAFTANSVAFS